MNIHKDFPTFRAFRVYIVRVAFTDVGQVDVSQKDTDVVRLVLLWLSDGDSSYCIYTVQTEREREKLSLLLTRCLRHLDMFIPWYSNITIPT